MMSRRFIVLSSLSVLTKTRRIRYEAVACQ